MSFHLFYAELDMLVIALSRLSRAVQPGVSATSAEICLEAGRNAPGTAPIIDIEERVAA